MKKLLTATLALAMGATIAGVVTGCNTNDPATNPPTDAETAEVAIGILRTWYAGDKEETDTDYQVAGKVQANENIYDVTWTVNPDASCTVENFGNYVKLSELNTDTDQYTVHVSNAEVKIEYTLTASVTVGEVTKTIDFKHYVPVGRVIVGDTTKGSLIPSLDTAQPGADDNHAVFKNDELSLTKDKYNSSSAVNPSYPDRCYQGSKVTIAYPGILQLKLTSDKTYVDGDKVTNYPELLKSSIEAAIWEGVTVSVNEETLVVTVNFETPVDSFEFLAKTQIRIKEINVTGQAGGSTAQNKVDGAKAMLALDTTEYSAAGTYDLPATKNGATVTWTVKETSEYVSVNSDGKLVISKLPAAETPVVLVANIAAGTDASATKEITIKIAPIAGVTHAGTKDDPYTPSEARIMAARLGDKEYSGTVYVTGFVVKCTEYKENFKNFDAIYIVDTYAADKDENSADALYIYRPAPDGTYLTTAGLNRGECVTFEGKLQNYGGTLELTSGKCVAKPEVSDDRTDAEKAADVLAAFKQKYDGKTVTGDISLTPSVEGATITIVSNDTSVITNAGVVTRPSADTAVELSVTVTYGTATTDPAQIVTVTVKAQLQLTGEGTLDNPYTVADVQKVLAGVGSDTTSTYYNGEGSAPVLVHVKGYVVVSGTWSSSNSNYTGVYIVDEYAADKDKNSSDALQIYGLVSNVAGLTLDATHAAPKGELITVTGYLQNRYGAYQVTYNSGTNPTVVKTEGVSDAIKVENALAALDEIKIIEANADGIALPASTVDGVTFTWSGTDETYPVADNKITVAALPSETDAEVTLTLTVTCGDVTVPQEVKIIIAKSGAPKDVAYTLDFGAGRPNEEKVSAYNKEWTATRNGLDWTIYGFNNNNNGWSLIKAGWTSQAVTATITSGKIDAIITKVSVDINAYNTSNGTVANFKLLVADNADFTNAQEVVGTMKAGTIDFTVPNPGANLYYRLVVDCNKASKNGFVELNSVTLSGYEATSTEVTPSETTPEE